MEFVFICTFPGTYHNLGLILIGPPPTDTRAQTSHSVPRCTFPLPRQKKMIFFYKMVRFFSWWTWWTDVEIEYSNLHWILNLSRVFLFVGLVFNWNQDVANWHRQGSPGACPVCIKYRNKRVEIVGNLNLRKNQWNRFQFYQSYLEVLQVHMSSWDFEKIFRCIYFLMIQDDEMEYRIFEFFF